MITASDKVGIVPSICSIVLCTIKESCWLTLGIRTSAKKTNQFTREFISKLDAVLPNVLEERRRRVGNNLGEIRKPAVGFHLPTLGVFFPHNF